MNLTLFFRLALMSIFQSGIVSLKKNIIGEPMSYETEFFYMPKVYAVDGWSVSLQINHGNYCSSVNGYRKLGHTMVEVEFGFPSDSDDRLKPYAEDPEDIKGTVGNVPVSVMEEIFASHGGIDWNKTISIETFNSFINPSRG